MTRFFSLENLSSKKIEKMMIDEFFCGAINISTQSQLQNQYARLIFKTIRKYSKLFESFILRMLRNILLQAG